MNNVPLPDLISSKIKSYEQIYLVKTNYDTDGVFDQYHLKEMLTFLEKLLDHADYIKVNVNYSPYNHDNSIKKRSVKCDEIPSHLIKFISGNDQHLYLSGYYLKDIYDDYDYETVEYDNTLLIRRYIAITIKKKYLNI